MSTSRNEPPSPQVALVDELYAFRQPDRRRGIWRCLEATGTGPWDTVTLRGPFETVEMSFEEFQRKVHLAFWKRRKKRSP